MDRFRLTLACLLALSSGACSFDLFHDTSWETACDIDPTTPGCAPDAASANDGGDASDAAAEDTSAPDVAEHDADGGDGGDGAD